MADLTAADETLPCGMCGAAPAVAVVDAPLSPDAIAAIDRAFATLHARRVVTDEELLAVCATCQTITDAALRDALRSRAAQPTTRSNPC